MEDNIIITDMGIIMLVPDSLYSSPALLCVTLVGSNN
jgi:hypothetical protein